MQKALNSANIKGEWIVEENGKNFMHNESIEPILTINGSEIKIWESHFANDFAKIAADQGAKQKDKAEIIPDIAHMTNSQARQEKKLFKEKQHKISQYSELSEQAGSLKKGKAPQADFSRPPITALKRSRSNEKSPKSAFSYAICASKPISGNMSQPKSISGNMSQSGMAKNQEDDTEAQEKEIDKYEEPKDPRFRLKKKPSDLKRSTANQKKTIDGKVQSVESNCMFYCAYLGSIKGWANFIWKEYGVRV